MQEFRFDLRSHQAQLAMDTLRLARPCLGKAFNQFPGACILGRRVGRLASQYDIDLFCGLFMEKMRAEMWELVEGILGPCAQIL